MNPTSSLALFRCVIQRELMLAWRRPLDVLSTLFFFVIAASLFPLSTNPDPELLRAIAPSVVWVAALLASMLSLERLFLADYNDGTLEQLLLSPQPLYLIVLAKAIAHWLISGLPLILVAPLLGVQFGLPAGSLLTLMGSLMLGVPVMSLIGAIGAALTLGLRNGGVLLSLLVLPLSIPALIFGAGTLEASVLPGGTAANFDLLGALLALALVLAPPATAAALRIALES